MPDTPKNARRLADFAKAFLCPAFFCKAAAAALIVGGAIFLTCSLAVFLSEKKTDWQNSLPSVGMSADQAKSALLRAKYMHEASIRPQLIRAGIVHAGDLGNNFPGHSHDEDAASSDSIIKALWTMRSFPELHEPLLALLLDESIPSINRVKSFYMYGGFLATMADALAGKDSNYWPFKYSTQSRISSEDSGWFASFRTPFLSKGAVKDQHNGEDTKLCATFAERFALAKEFLPLILAGIQKDAAFQEKCSAQEENEEDQTEQPCSCKNETADYLDNIRSSASEAMQCILEERGNPGFLSLVKELLSSEEGSLQNRYGAVPLAAEKPGLPPSEYIFWQQYHQNFISTASCVGTSPRAYAYLLGCMGDFMEAAAKELKTHGSFVLGGQEGPGIIMERVDTLAPARNVSGNLYLLADMAPAMKNAPEYDLSRAVPIFTGSLFRHLENQPLVLPLTPRNPKDAAVIKWYAEEGWKLDRTVLFSAIGSPADVARHWGSVHLLWWSNEEKEADPSLALLHPVSGHFMAGFLSHLRGKGVTRVLGPVTGLWFGRQNVDETGWLDEKYAARPENMPAPYPVQHAPLRSPLFDRLRKDAAPDMEAVRIPPAYTENAAAIILSQDVILPLSENYRHNYSVTLARKIAGKFPTDEQPPLEIFSFVENTKKMLGEWKLSTIGEVDFATELLWQFREDTARKNLILDILSNTEQSPHDRIHEVRRALALPEAKDSREN